MAVLCLVWGSTWLVISTGLKDLPPFTSAAIRFTLAALLLGALAPWLQKKETGRAPGPWLSLSMGILVFGVPYGIVYWGETVVPSGLASVLWAVFPILMGIAAHFQLPDERLSRGNWIGFAAGFVGVALLFVTDLRQAGPKSVTMGAIFLLSPLVSSVGTTIAKRHGGEVSSVLLNRNGFFIGALSLWIGVLLWERTATPVWSARAVFSIVYLAVAGTILTFCLYYWLMRSLSASRLSLIAYVIPVISLCLGSTIGGEPISAYTVLGTALILGGVGLGARSRRPSSPAVEQEPSAPA